jgi:hypothetical protein
MPVRGVFVGAAPLRRLSNREYLLSLADLFPQVALGDLPPLPDDADLAGFDNAAEGQVPSDVRIARYADIADRYARALADDEALVRCDESDAEACAARLIAEQGRRVYRRRLDALEEERLLRLFRRGAQAVDFAAGISLAVSAMLQSPQFLYRLEEPPAGAGPGVYALDDVALATRLSYFLWESTPDEALLEAAEAGELSTAEGLRTVVTRMLNDARVGRTLWDFHRQWLGLDRILGAEHEARAPSVDASWTATRQHSAYDETRRFVEGVLSEDGRLRDLLLSRKAWLDADMAGLYGVPVPTAADGAALLPEAERAGILTRAAFLAGLSHPGTTSPPIRANAIQLRMLCRPPIPPPPGVSTTLDDLALDDAPHTTRALFERKTQAASCQGCHVNLNGLGFGLERYDAAGRFRSLENGLPVDDSGHVYMDGSEQPFSGGIALSAALATSRDVAACAVKTWLRFALGRAAAPEEAPLLARLSASFAEGGGELRALMGEIALSDSFRYRLVEAEP